jgi:long-chain fatty acid transport protein
MRFVSLLLCLMAINQSDAAGFSLAEQNASGLGNAYAGAAAVAENASTIYHNPAGMVYLKGKQFSIALHALNPSSSFHNTNSTKAFGTPAFGNEGGDIGDLALIPSMYYSQEISPALFLGVGLNAPFGLKTEYDNQWIGRFQALKSELKTININPAIAYRVNDQLAIGAGISAMWAEAELTRALNTVLGPESSVKVKGDNWGLGFNLGVMYQPSPDARIGVAYRSKVRQKLSGTVSSPLHTFDANPASTLNTNTTADLTLPQSLSISVLNHLNNKWDITADLTWTGWSDFQDLTIVRNNGTTLISTPENWQDTMRYSIGASYQYTENLKFRSGIAFDEEAIQDNFRTANIPGNDRTWLAFGLNWQASKTGLLDLGYAHIFVKDASVNQLQNTLAQGFNGNLTGQYQGQVDILSAQYTYQF